MSVRDDLERWRIAADALAEAQRQGEPLAIARAQALETALLETLVYNLHAADARHDAARARLRNELWEMLDDQRRELWERIDRLALQKVLGDGGPSGPDAPG